MIDFISNNAGAIGVIFFSLTFISIAIWALNPKSKSKIESYKYIPLSEEK